MSQNFLAVFVIIKVTQKTRKMYESQVKVGGISKPILRCRCC